MVIATFFTRAGVDDYRSAATIGLERESTERVSIVDRHCDLSHLLGHEPGNRCIARRRCGTSEKVIGDASILIPENPLRPGALGVATPLPKRCLTRIYMRTAALHIYGR